MTRTITADGNTVTATHGALCETMHFASEEEAGARAAVANHALSYVGTPFRNCADVKGPKGGIDCAMLLVRSFVDTGQIEPFDPRPYPADWFLYSREERFLGWLEGTFKAKRVDSPRIGDIVIWQFGLCFSHSAIYVGNGDVVHAYAIAGVCLTSRLCDDELDKFTLRGIERPRPRIYFDYWARG